MSASDGRGRSFPEPTTLATAGLRMTSAVMPNEPATPPARTSTNLSSAGIATVERQRRADDHRRVNDEGAIGGRAHPPQ